MPLPVMHLRNKQTIVKTVNAPNCHCEERSDVAISQYPAGSQGTPGEYGNFTRHSVENAALYKARAVGNHTTKLGACKALRERRYTPYFGVCHFNDSLFGSAAYRRARLSPPLQGACVCPAVGINRQCLPEIATGAKRPRNDKSEAIAVLTVVCTNRQHIAGSHAKSAPRGRGAQVFSVSALDVGEVAHGLLYGAEVGK